MCARARASVNRALVHRNPNKGTKTMITILLVAAECRTTRTDLAVGSSESGQTLTGVAVDAVHTGAAILTGKGGTLVDGWKERTVK